MVRVIIIVISFCLFSNLFAAVDTKKDLEALYLSFNEADYEEAIKQSNNLILTLDMLSPAPEAQLGLIYYWRGLSFNRKKDYKKAAESLEKSILHKFSAQDLIYEYAKALYGMGELKKAQEQFNLSVEKKLNISLCEVYLNLIAEELRNQELVIEEKKELVITPKPLPIKKPDPKILSEIDKDLLKARIKLGMEKVYEAFKTGLYARASRLMENLEQEMKPLSNENKELEGLVAYWKGLTFNRQFEFSESTKAFEKAISHDFKASDLYYEYAQALYGSEKIPEALIAFKNSYDQKYKAGVCLYYLGFLNQEEGKTHEANTYYQMISSLPAEERKDVEQAAQMQIADMQLALIESKPDAIRGVELVVIPQYKKAVKLNSDSNLAGEMNKKIRELQQKYELVLFKMRNNRPTQVPPYFVRFSLDNAFDDNVVYSADETNLAQSDKASGFTKADLMGRYSLYYKNIMSFSPELRMNRTEYHNSKDTIKANNNYALVPALRTAYEHTLFEKPASHLLDYEYNYAHRDLNSDDKLIFSSRTHTYMIGERFNLLSLGESILRYRQRHFESYNTSSNSITKSFVLEQILSFKTGHMLILVGSFDQSNNENDLFDTKALMTRGDLIFPKYKDWFTPTIGLGVTFTDPYNSDRGLEKQINPSLKMTRTFGPRLRGTLRFEYWKNTSNVESFQYTKAATGAELEYVF
jgi:hypothetical protein